MLQTCDSALSFSTNVWTSEAHHHSFVTIIVHLEHNGLPLAMVLDVIEVAEVSYELNESSQQASESI